MIRRGTILLLFAVLFVSGVYAQKTALFWRQRIISALSLRSWGV